MGEGVPVVITAIPQKYPMAVNCYLLNRVAVTRLSAVEGTFYLV
jgi:hypothetical protein